MIPNIYPGCFFVVEGIDGCGKSEQFKKLTSYLANKVRTVFGTKEPGKNRTYGAKIYNDLKDPNGFHKTDPFRFQMLYAMDSKEHLVKEVIPRLRAGCSVVSDRFRSSMVFGVKLPYPKWFWPTSYQPANRIILDKLMGMNQAIIGEDFIWPDAILIFDVKIETAIQRLQKQGKILDGHENTEVLSSARDSYLLFSGMYPNCHLIDAEPEPEKIFEKVKKIVDTVLESRRKKFPTIT